MSLDAPHARGIGLPTNVQVVKPDTDGGRFACPRCQRSLTDSNVGTPRVPSEILDEDSLVLSFQEADQDRIPVFGWTCERHRRETVVPAAYDDAPEPYAPVEADLDGRKMTIAVPNPVFEKFQ
jgi:hypothetical protein